MNTNNYSLRRYTVYKLLGLLGLFMFLLISICAGILFGVTHVPLRTLIESFTNFDGSNAHLIIRTTRVPRVLIAAIVGGSLAAAGAVMQAITRNPLASPSIFGINAGAAFFIVVASAYFGAESMNQFIWLALIGACITVFVVYGLGSIGSDGLTPIKITLAGSAITALFMSFTQGILLTSGKAFDQVLPWLVGSVSGKDLDMLVKVLPYFIIGWITALILSRHLNVLAMGEDMARGLGQKTGYIKLACALLIVLLAGSSVAIAGPIAFIGIMIPHAARYLVGADYRWIIPYCFVLGALLLVLADLGSRFVAMPKEVPVGVLTAIIGVPFFVFIARKGGQR
ncbi:iron ABC transporter permease [Paenibacillus sp. N1-5-1-14]|uniref:FecCD family ABC transporter permease n=1 Tax=Paenibacillus radicibacter TaxID=2972488 RepID=UPI00215983C6|nr:iron ABC transporter permease [Paenibacillus radicibacter]MCR8644931.1 iron ABC transporter permease [Paenibacillus radicibacter]